jgi:hypothetical protein
VSVVVREGTLGSQGGVGIHLGLFLQSSRPCFSRS